MPGKHNAGGCGCCGCEHCFWGVPRKMTVRLSDGSAVPAYLSPAVDKCKWTGSAATGDFEFYLVDVAGTLTARLTLDNGGDETIWELDVDAYEPMDCCEDLDGLVLACISSEEDYCTDGVTATIGAICGPVNVYVCDDCTDGNVPSTLRVTLRDCYDYTSGLIHCCASWDGTYFLPFVGNATTCKWELTECLDACGSFDVGDITVYASYLATYTKGIVILDGFANVKSQEDIYNTTLLSVCDGNWGTGNCAGGAMPDHVHADVEAD